MSHCLVLPEKLLSQLFLETRLCLTFLTIRVKGIILPHPTRKTRFGKPFGEDIVEAVAISSPGIDSIHSMIIRDSSYFIAMP